MVPAAFPPAALMPAALVPPPFTAFPAPPAVPSSADCSMPRVPLTAHCMLTTATPDDMPSWPVLMLTEVAWELSGEGEGLGDGDGDMLKRGITTGLENPVLHKVKTRNSSSSSNMSTQTDVTLHKLACEGLAAPKNPGVSRPLMNPGVSRPRHMPRQHACLPTCCSLGSIYNLCNHQETRTHVLTPGPLSRRFYYALVTQPQHHQ